MSTGSDELSPVEILAEEFLERQQRGEKPSIREIRERITPNWPTIQVLEAVAMVEELKPDSNDVTGTFAHLTAGGQQEDRIRLATTASCVKSVRGHGSRLRS